MDSDFADSISKYRFLNDQFMSKAIELLKTADNLMIEPENDEIEIPILKKEKFKTAEFQNQFDNVANDFSNDKSSREFNLSDCAKSLFYSVENDTDTFDDKPFENIAFEEFMKSKNKIKSKFAFPKNPSNAKETLLETESIDNLSGDEIETDDLNDINGVKRIINSQNECDDILKKFLNMKANVQLNAKKSPTEIEKTNHTSKVNVQCVKVLKSKIETLQGDLLTSQENLKKKTSECDKLFKENQSLLETKIKLTAQINMLKSQTKKKDEKNQNLYLQKQAAENECRSIKNEQESFIRTIKEGTQEVSNAEIKLMRTMKELATVKESLNIYKSQEKELKETTHKKIEECSAMAKEIEKREKEFEATVKKQSQILDNLRKQIVYFSTSENTNKSEKKFDSTLELEIKLKK